MGVVVMTIWPSNARRSRKPCEVIGGGMRSAAWFTRGKPQFLTMAAAALIVGSTASRRSTTGTQA